MRRFAGSILRSYTITLLVVGVALLSVGSVLAADSSATSSTSELLQSFIGGVIASTIVNLFAQVHFRRVASRAQKTEAKVDTLSRELGVDDPNKATPDITKMQTEVQKLGGDVETLQDELTKTLQERNTAEELLAKQVEASASDKVNAQAEVDQWRGRYEGEKEVSANLERQLTNYEARIHEMELKQATFEGRLQQQALHDNMAVAIQGFVAAVEKIAERLAVPAVQPEANPT